MNQQPIANVVQQLNELIPIHSMWDGFWIAEFSNQTLSICCSFDRLSYRNYDIDFKGVIFFNIPPEWRDTNIKGDKLFRVADITEFETQQPDFRFDQATYHIFALDIWRYPPNATPRMETYYIVASHVTAAKCLPGFSNPYCYYTDRFENDPASYLKNRILS